MRTPFIIVVRDNVVETAIKSEAGTCNGDFISRVRTEMGDEAWEALKPEELSDLMDEGYFLFGSGCSGSEGSVCLTWIDI